MTSSLVGSEMCIRDRRGGPVVPSKGRWTKRRRHPTTRRVPTVQACLRPVSYTHLTLPTICSV
eukprot:3684445-Prorocentrum_lima.AAC.1